jgi:predicted ArsR family transcriptional regulator
VYGIHGYRSAEKNSEWLTLRDAAAKLGVSHHQVRKLIKAGILNSEQNAGRTTSDPCGRSRK